MSSVSLINGHIDPDTSKMTPKKAYKILKDTPIRAKENHTEYSKALHIAIAALEKQIPKKPVCRIDVHTNTPTGFCPECSLLVHENITERHGNTNYCRFCGQALDWGDSE